ncbi:hypothetical protein MHBO_002511 [Bonamia ostreae]|uniref:Uncharacterized protein n=1 Tax=Bonamia ostreae TaxID=126728 RepID=A0ABV2AN73_9EUKA
MGKKKSSVESVSIALSDIAENAPKTIQLPSGPTQGQYEKNSRDYGFNQNTRCNYKTYRVNDRQTSFNRPVRNRSIQRFDGSNERNDEAFESRRNSWNPKNFAKLNPSRGAKHQFNSSPRQNFRRNTIDTENTSFDGPDQKIVDFTGIRTHKDKSDSADNVTKRNTFNRNVSDRRRNREFSQHNSETRFGRNLNRKTFGGTERRENRRFQQNRTERRNLSSKTSVFDNFRKIEAPVQKTGPKKDTTKNDSDKTRTNENGLKNGKNPIAKNPKNEKETTKETTKSEKVRKEQTEDSERQKLWQSRNRKPKQQTEKSSIKPEEKATRGISLSRLMKMTENEKKKHLQTKEPKQSFNYGRTEKSNDHRSQNDDRKELSVADQLKKRMTNRRGKEDVLTKLSRKQLLNEEAARREELKKRAEKKIEKQRKLAKRLERLFIDKRGDNI